MQIKKLTFSVACSVLLIMAFTACHAKQGEQKKVEDRISCHADADCRLSCRYGAVSKTWYDKNQAILKDCLDGCEEANVAKCMNSSCVAVFWQNQTEINKSCTNLTEPLPSK